MDTCVGCRIVGYIFSVYWPSVCDLGPIRGFVLSIIININSPDGAKYSQTVYVPKYSPRARARGFCDCWKLTFNHVQTYKRTHDSSIIVRWEFQNRKYVMSNYIKK